jgi:hypothetical protein
MSGLANMKRMFYMDNNNPQVMQSENQTPRNGGFKKFLSRRNIFLVLGLIVAAEVIWALWALVLSPSQGSVIPQFGAPKPQTTSVSLLSPTQSLKVGDIVTVTAKIDSDKLTDGTDLVITYNPQALEVQNTASGVPVAAGLLYDDYPFNNVDIKMGRITVSGITTRTDGTLASGIFGTVTFRALIEGEAKVSLLFNMGDTTDSNVIETGTGKDVLDEVNNLELKILP